MSEVMAMLLNERDFGEELTSFQSDEDDDDEDEDDEDIDLDDDEDMYMLYEDEPPSYDVEARLKELNEALKNEIIPADYEERSRKVQFKENPIFMEIYTSSGFSDDEDNEEDVDDDGYGDSTEVSDEVNEENGIARVQEPVPTTMHELARLLEQKRNDAKKAQENLTEGCNNVTLPNLDDENDSLNSELEQKLIVADEKVEVVLPEINVENNEVNLSSALTEDVSLSSTETLDAAQSTVVTLNVSSEKCDVSVPEKGGESFLNKSKSAQVVPKNVSESRNSARRVSPVNGASNKSIKIRPRSSSVPPKINSNSDSMIMASKGKFHVMTTDDIQVRRSVGSAKLDTSRNTRTNVRTPPKSASSINSRQQSAIQKTGSLKLSPGSSETSIRNGSLKSPPSVKDAVPSPKIRPQYSGEGPSRYGLTTAQKMEKKLNSKLIMDNFQGKKQETLAEKARKKEQMDEAYRMWLQRKKLHAKQKSSPLKDSKNSSQNSSQNEVDGETCDSSKRKSGPAFDDWLLMKKMQKKKNLEIERMKKKVEMEISYVKSTEQNRKNFDSWTKQKKRGSPNVH